jgi:molybdopterin-guanine dinucleotide biosynthesis protein A
MRPDLLPLTGVILAGGKSQRMGQDKALLPFGPTLLIERIIHRLRVLTDRLLIITNTPAQYSFFHLPLSPDLLPDKSSLGGIYTGLRLAETEQILFIACDMPFISIDFLHYLWKESPGFDVVIPCNAEGFQPLCALYTKHCLPAITHQIAANQLKITECFHFVRTKVVTETVIRHFDPHGRMFYNMNTPEEYAQALAWLAAEETP